MMRQNEAEVSQPWITRSQCFRSVRLTCSEKTSNPESSDPTAPCGYRVWTVGRYDLAYSLLFNQPKGEENEENKNSLGSRFTS
jgi:hypothetical protein